MLVYFLFILGFIFAIKGASLLVDGASFLAKRMRISELVIGLTIVAFGTSLPELIVNIVSNLKGSADMAMGNILGANIANILLVTGLAAIIAPIRITKSTSNKNTIFALSIIGLLFLLVNNFFINYTGIKILSRLDGLVLIISFILFLYYVIGDKRKEKPQDVSLVPAKKESGILLALSMVTVGIVALGLGGEWIVTGGVAIAKAIGLSEKAIGLTVIAIGTTLPELFTSIYAALKRKADIAIGNIIGAVVFNIAFILGLSSVIKALPFNSALNIDIGISFLAVLLLYYFSRNGRKTDHIERWEGIGLFTAYLLYAVFLVWRG